MGTLGKTQKLSFGCALALLLFLPASVCFASESRVRWVHSEAGYDFYHAAVSADGKKVAFVRKLHRPDPHGRSESEIAAWRARREIEPRFEDPEVVFCVVRTSACTGVDWGWHPAFSPDGTTIAYIQQTKPISGYRVLASTLAGNELWQYDLEQRKRRRLAAPKQHYLSDPIYSLDGKWVVFAYSAPANGSFGGPVGVGRVNLETLEEEPIYAPKKELNLPPKFQGTRDRGGLFHLITDRIQNRHGLFFLAHEPRNHNGFSAAEYDVTLYCFVDDRQVLYQWTDHSLIRSDEQQIGYHVEIDGSVRVLDDTWKTAAGQPTRPRQLGVPSPDGKFIAKTDENSIELYRGRRQIRRIRAFRLREMQWGTSSKWIICVSTLRHYNGDQIILLRV